MNSVQCSLQLIGLQSGLRMKVLDVGFSKRDFRLFTTELTSDRTLRNWYHFIVFTKSEVVAKYVILFVLSFSLGYENHCSVECFL